MARVTITISKGGKTQIAVSGASGTRCTDMTKRIEAALGDTESDVKTAEFYQTETETDHEREHATNRY